jgi:hypothetical protein
MKVSRLCGPSSVVMYFRSAASMFGSLCGNIRRGLENIRHGLGNIRHGLGNIRHGLGNNRQSIGQSESELLADAPSRFQTPFARF